MKKDHDDFLNKIIQRVYMLFRSSHGENQARHGEVKVKPQKLELKIAHEKEKLIGYRQRKKIQTI